MSQTVWQLSVPVLLLLLLVLCLAIQSHAQTAPDVVVKNLKLFYNGTEFIVKGVAYNPAPIGFLNASGLCSIHITAFNGSQTYDSACFDSDFFDGGTYPMDDQPAGGWFNALWQRDLPSVAALGANTIRVYNANPTTRQASEEYIGTYNIVAPWGKDHVPFFDYAYSQGLKIIWPLFSDATALLTFPDDKFEWYLARQIDEVGNHPALLLYILGNELNYVGNYSVWQELLQRVNTLAAYARQYQLTTWNRSIPITTGTDDNEDYYVMLMETLTNFDFISPNAGYRGTTFTNLWDGSGYPGQAIFPGFYNLSCYYQKPLLIAEMNPLGYDNPPPGTYLPSGFNEQWWDLLNHVSEGAIGGLFFEWSNEDWKAGGNQSNLGLVATSVACSASNVCSSDVDVWLPDNITRKDWLYQSVCCGSYNNISYNLQTDPFLLLGRLPEQLETASQPCPASMIGPPPPSPVPTALSTPSAAPTTTVISAASSSATATAAANTASSSVPQSAVPSLQPSQLLTPQQTQQRQGQSLPSSNAPAEPTPPASGHALFASSSSSYIEALGNSLALLVAVMIAV